MENTATGGQRRHLTWRDLPPSPPLGPAPHVVPAGETEAAGSPAAAAPRTRRRGRTAAVFGAGLLAGALILVGAGAVASGLGSPQVTDALGQAAPGQQGAQSAGPAAQPQAARNRWMGPLAGLAAGPRQPRDGLLGGPQVERVHSPF